MNNEAETIMVVDDTPANLKLLQEILQTQGYRVMQFPRGAMALKAATRKPPDLILLDIMMPEMDGFEVCQRLKSNKKLKDIPVLFISALDNTEDKVKAFSVGGVDYVSKPFHEEEVLARVKTHLELQRQSLKIKQLLNETLMGAVKALNDMLAFSSPQTYNKNIIIAQYIRKFCVDHNLEYGWIFNVAANFWNLGYIASSSSYKKEMDETTPHQPQTNPPNKLDKQSIKETAHIVRCIPRLDRVAAMIENIGISSKRTDDWQSWPLEILGGEILTIAAEFESRMQRGFSANNSLELISKYNIFNQQLIQDFAKSISIFDTSNENTQTDNKFTQLQADYPADLLPGHILMENLLTQDGRLMLSKGTQLTENLCMLIQEKTKSNKIVFPVYVLPEETSA